VPKRRRPVIMPDEKLALDRGHLARYVPGVLDRRIPPRHWDGNAGERGLCLRRRLGCGRSGSV
jgi:hypothetical protein